MEIKFTNYADGVHDIEFVEPVEKVGLKSPFFGNLNLNCKMDKSSGQIVLDCDLSLLADMTCDRCVNQFEENIESSFELVYIFSKEQIEKDSDEVYYISPESSKIKLDADVIEYANLALPMKYLCDEKCKGLCPKCGEDLNINQCDCKDDEVNPIWEPLLKLKDKSNN